MKNIPEAFLVPDGPDGFRLSEWGTVVWDNQAKGLLASANLLQLPHIEYAPSFVGDYNALASPQRAQVQAALLKAAAALATGGITALTEHTGLLYSSLESRKDSKAPIDYFRVNDDIRITCVRRGPYSDFGGWGAKIRRSTNRSRKHTPPSAALDERARCSVRSQRYSDRAPCHTCRPESGQSVELVTMGTEEENDG